MNKSIFIVVMLAMLISCDSKENLKEPTKIQTNKTSDSILRFAKKYNAIVGWDNLDIFATVQFEELIINKKKPLLIKDIFFWFHDIYRSNDDYHLLFSSALEKYYFDLECDSLQKSEILNRVNQTLIFNMIAIIEIYQVKKIDRIVETDFIDSETIDLNLGYTNSFALKGKIIDIFN